MCIRDSLYPPAAQLPITPLTDVPRRMPPIAYHQNTWKHFPHRYRPGSPVSAGIARTARRAYYACVSFADSLVGEVLSALDDSGQRNSTVVLLTSDHGFHLGEQNVWGKQTLFELSLRVPLIVRAPHLTSAAAANGRSSDAFVELIDLYRCLLYTSPSPRDS